MSRNILLVEPGYKTKFPPLGLMKISSYHKSLGDNVSFVKGIKNSQNFKFWDRIYISTVFTYNWKITVDTINHYKSVVSGDISRLYVGGIMASLMPNELWKQTGVFPKIGVLVNPGALDDDNDLVVENMIPDYELFDDCSHPYTLIDDSYFGYSTRGCVNKCEFCGVPRLEPKYMEYQGIKPYVEGIRDRYGDKCNLVLFDNNVLASKKFNTIINDIVDLGFQRDAKFEYLNKVNSKTKRARHVDFNQGTDARILTSKKAKQLARIAINPLRIAFDSIKFEKIYKRAIRYAAENEIVNLSNYILYNHKDSPEDFWQRLKINIDLNNEYDLKIYSFPMKYLPLDSVDRSYVSSANWNWLFLRNVQRIVNVMKGPVMPSESFFNRAFGESQEEFVKILHMPERIIMWRSRQEGSEEKDWSEKFAELTKNERKELVHILCENRKVASLEKTINGLSNQKLKNILEYYLPEKVKCL